MRKNIWKLVMRAGLLLFLLPLLLAMNAGAASFDCAKATTKVEKMICGDAELSKKDEELATAYKTALMDEKQAATIRETQKEWLKARNRCTDSTCVKSVYEKRFEKLVSAKYMSQSADVDLTKKTGNEPILSKPLTHNYLRGQGFKDEPFNFKLTKGQGVPVCEAYLKRLNNTDFDNAPFCGRPEDDSVPGFKRLNRVPLTADEIYDLYPKMDGFESYQNQKLWKKEFMSLNSIKNYMCINRLGAWRYDPPVDIDNDGKPDNIIIWYGGGGYACGSINYNSPYPAHSSYTANVLDDQNQYIDEARTRELFEHPKGWFEIESKRFRYIGIEMGIFFYEGKYYFDTFFNGWGDFEGRRRDSKKMTETLAVFLRKDKRTEQVCEYYWTNSNNLYPGSNSK